MIKYPGYQYMWKPYSLLTQNLTNNPKQDICLDSDRKSMNMELWWKNLVNLFITINQCNNKMAYYCFAAQCCLFYVNLFVWCCVWLKNLNACITVNDEKSYNGKKRNIKETFFILLQGLCLSVCIPSIILLTLFCQ